MKLFTRFFLILALLAGTALAADDAVTTDESLEQVRARIAEIFEVIDPDNVTPAEVEGWYMIQKGSIIAYISADGRYLLQGDLIDLDANLNLSMLARDGARRELIAELGDDEVIRFSPETVRHSVTVFTDTGCIYCRRLHSQIDQYMANGIEVRYVLYPRNGPTSREWSTSESIWCARDRNGALTAAKLDRNFDSTSCDASIVQQHFVLGREIGLSGTPAIVLEDGTLISGYMPPDALLQRLEQQTTSASR